MGMRRGRDSGWMEHEGKLVAVNLGADFTAEHEWGIKELQQTLGVNPDPKVLGIERFRIKKTNNDCVLLVENKKDVSLLVVKQYDVKYVAEKSVDIFSELKPYKDELATAWCEGSLGIRSKNPEDTKKIKLIHNAIINGDAAIWLGGGHVFQNAGLVIGIISQIPDHLKKEMHDAHVEANKLQEASDKTGIKAKLDAVNEKYREERKGFSGGLYPPCGYYALSPSWIREGAKATSKHPVMYWLNPMDQQKNKYGWYTVEQLEQWIEGKGPIVERAAS